LVAPVPALAPGGYELSYSERQRIANLEQIEKLTTAYREQRQAATLEIANIRRGVVARMSADDLVKKDQYWADLSRLEAERRRAAASQLVNLFAAYR
jgi:50S ribosomal subunit-associated GTPase HflX